jgi:hypothetical protein
MSFFQSKCDWTSRYRIFEQRPDAIKACFQIFVEEANFAGVRLALPNFTEFARGFRDA